MIPSTAPRRFPIPPPKRAIAATEQQYSDHGHSSSSSSAKPEARWPFPNAAQTLLRIRTQGVAPLRRPTLVAQRKLSPSRLRQSHRPSIPRRISAALPKDKLDNAASNPGITQDVPAAGPPAKKRSRLLNVDEELDKIRKEAEKRKRIRRVQIMMRKRRHWEQKKCVLLSCFLFAFVIGLGLISWWGLIYQSTDWPPTPFSHSSFLAILRAFIGFVVISLFGFIVLALRIRNIFIGILFMYSSGLVLSLSVQAISKASVCLYQDQLFGTMSFYMRQSLVENGEVQRFYDTMQNGCECCGFSDIDIIKSWPAVLGTGNLPAGCCMLSHEIDYGTNGSCGEKLAWTYKEKRMPNGFETFMWDSQIPLWLNGRVNINGESDPPRTDLHLAPFSAINFTTEFVKKLIQDMLNETNEDLGKSEPIRLSSNPLTPGPKITFTSDQYFDKTTSELLSPQIPVELQLKLDVFVEELLYVGSKTEDGEVGTSSDKDAFIEEMRKYAKEGDRWFLFKMPIKKEDNPVFDDTIIIPPSPSKPTSPHPTPTTPNATESTEHDFTSEKSSTTSETPSTTKPPCIDCTESCGLKQCYLPDCNHNCESYYECNNGIPTHRFCQLNYYFHPKLKKCVPLQNGEDCTGSTLTTTTTTTTINGSLSTSSSASSSSVAIPNTTSTTTASFTHSTLTTNSTSASTGWGTGSTKPESASTVSIHLTDPTTNTHLTSMSTGSDTMSESQTVPSTISTTIAGTDSTLPNDLTSTMAGTGNDSTKPESVSLYSTASTTIAGTDSTLPPHLTSTSTGIGTMAQSERAPSTISTTIAVTDSTALPPLTSTSTESGKTSTSETEQSATSTTVTGTASTLPPHLTSVSTGSDTTSESQTVPSTISTTIAGTDATLPNDLTSTMAGTGIDSTKSESVSLYSTVSTTIAGADSSSSSHLTSTSTGSGTMSQSETVHSTISTTTASVESSSSSHLTSTSTGSSTPSKSESVSVQPTTSTTISSTYSTLPEQLTSTSTGSGTTSDLETVYSTISATIPGTDSTSPPHLTSTSTGSGTMSQSETGQSTISTTIAGTDSTTYPHLTSRSSGSNTTSKFKTMPSSTASTRIVIESTTASTTIISISSAASTTASTTSTASTTASTTTTPSTTIKSTTTTAPSTKPTSKSTTTSKPNKPRLLPPPPVAVATQIEERKKREAETKESFISTKRLNVQQSGSDPDPDSDARKVAGVVSAESPTEVKDELNFYYVTRGITENFILRGYIWPNRCERSVRGQKKVHLGLRCRDLKRYFPKSSRGNLQVLSHDTWNEYPAFKAARKRFDRQTSKVEPKFRITPFFFENGVYRIMWWNIALGCVVIGCLLPLFVIFWYFYSRLQQERLTGLSEMLSTDFDLLLIDQPVSEELAETKKLEEEAKMRQNVVVELEKTRRSTGKKEKEARKSPAAGRRGKNQRVLPQFVKTGFKYYKK